MQGALSMRSRITLSDAASVDRNTSPPSNSRLGSAGEQVPLAWTVVGATTLVAFRRTDAGLWTAVRLPLVVKQPLLTQIFQLSETPS